MARKAVLITVAVACVLLAIASYAEAQGCKSLNIVDLLPCQSGLNSGTCSAQCKAKLQPYTSVSDKCVCQLVNQVSSRGFDKNKIKTLLINCRFGRKYPNC